MPSKTLVRTFILIQVAVLILMTAAGYLFMRNAPDALRFITLQRDRYRPGATPIEVVTALALVVSTIGIFFFWRGMRTVYLIVMIVSVLESIYLGPFVNSGPASFLEDAANTISGIIIGLAFFSPAKELFERRAPAVSRLEPPPMIVYDPVEAIGPRNAGPRLPDTAAVPPAVPWDGVPAPAAPAYVDNQRAAGAGAQRFAATAEPQPVWHAPAPSAPTPAPVSSPADEKPVPTCSKCGTPATGTKFCEECGALLPTTIQCPACGAEIKPGKKFCGECGGSVR